MKVNTLNNIFNLYKEAAPKKKWPLLLTLIALLAAASGRVNGAAFNFPKESVINEHNSFNGPKDEFNYPDKDPYEDSGFGLGGMKLKFEHLEEMNNAFFMHNNKKINMIQFPANNPIQDRCFVYEIDMSNDTLEPIGSYQRIKDKEDKVFIKAFEKSAIKYVNELQPPTSPNYYVHMTNMAIERGKGKSPKKGIDRGGSAGASVLGPMPPWDSTVLMPTPVGGSPVGPSPMGPSPMGPSPMGPSPMGPSPMGPSPMGPSPMGLPMGLPMGSSMGPSMGPPVGAPGRMPMMPGVRMPMGGMPGSPMMPGVRTPMGGVPGSPMMPGARMPMPADGSAVAGSWMQSPTSMQTPLTFVEIKAAEKTGESSTDSMDVDAADGTTEEVMDPMDVDVGDNAIEDSIESMDMDAGDNATGEAADKVSDEAAESASGEMAQNAALAAGENAAGEGADAASGENAEASVAENAEAGASEATASTAEADNAEGSNAENAAEGQSTMDNEEGAIAGPSGMQPSDFLNRPEIANNVFERYSQYYDEMKAFNDSFLFAAVIDGHGGEVIADIVKRWLGFYVKKQLLEKLRNNDHQILTPSDIVASLEEAHIQLDNDILKKAKEYFFKGNVRYTRNGSCSISVLMDKNYYYVSNVGDSKGLLIKKDSIVRLNNIQNASEITERMRLVQEHPNEIDVVMCKRSVKNGNAKSFEIFSLTEQHTQFQMFDVGRCYVKGRLQCTRSFGDFYLKHKIFAFDYRKNKFLVKEPHSFPYISAIPEVLKIRRTQDDEFVVLVSDGISDHLSDKEIYDIVKQYSYSVKKMSRILIQTVLIKAAMHVRVSAKELLTLVPPDRRRKFFDDMSVVVIKLK
ncbi:protein phosphatase PPM8, putative [Plasmodium vivax]|uniref:Protein phosphatase 2C domain containing protein n=2 Tax=Plasmodium vivax TaxID=5855 RepID=A5K510_PLAVS|nr:protein phosphatase 2C domain containing protein [Plasmodium vivax]EDL45738.1 protein phosphatase 2C domain containing protein [Plasmodium vivax]KMZ86491.1 protein phosphatase 2C domain-containing protein [Plasmodium vivax Brazil I]CAI7720636.1 protein phosphatase PPM8, putative [Plasmodium vivax]|eukprot:XP_001615465.1 protein phosphatase 2C domain containing protein [Plasmodium vivax Sal-1]